MLTQAQAAAEQRSQYLRAIMDRGLALFHEGKLDSAEVLFQTVAEEPAVKPLVAHMRGIIALQLGEKARAQELIEEAITLNPADTEAHSNLGRILLEDRQNGAALAAYAASLTVRPGNVVAHYGLARAMAGLGLNDLAFDTFRDVLALEPDNVDALIDYGTLLNDLGRHDEAVATLRDALARNPERTELDAAITASMHPAPAGPEAPDENKRAIAAFRDALTRHPERPELHTLLGFCLIATGDWKAAWPQYEWRLKDGDLGKKLLETDRPRWQGEDLTGKTILLQCEQGFGDVLQFVRYAPMVKARGGRVMLRAQEPLLPLLRSVDGIDVLFGTKEKAPDFDVHVPLLSLPMIFETEPDTVPATTPYLTPDPELVRTWRERLGPHEGVTIGLVWQGNPAHSNDKYRSVRLDALRPLLDCPGARFVSLQIGPGQDQLKGLEDRITDLAPSIDASSFADAAAIVANLDLVIAIDSAVVHLAGALDKPAWILLALNNDWRWLKGRSDSPWYPKARLFRQTKAGEWDEVIKRVRSELWSFAGADAPPDDAMTDEITALALRLSVPPQAANPVVCDALFMEGVRQHGAGNLERAKKLFEQVLVLDMRHVNTLCNLGALSLALGDEERALELLERAITLAPDLAPARTAFADALMVAQHTDQAMAQHRKAIELAPKSETAHAAYASALRQLGDSARAKAHFGEAEKLTRERFHNALRLAPNNDALHAEYAMALHRFGDLDGAMTHFMAAVQITQAQSGEFYEALGRTCAATGNPEGAEISLNHALALNPKLATAHCALGDLYRERGRAADAEASFRRALAIDPDCAPALRALEDPSLPQGSMLAPLGRSVPLPLAGRG